MSLVKTLVYNRQRIYIYKQFNSQMIQELKPQNMD